MPVLTRFCALLPGLLVACAGVEPEPAAPELEPGPRSVRVAACQLRLLPGREENLAAIDRALALAAEQGADLACFPETCLLGWVNPEAHQLAHPIPGETSARLGAMAARHGLMISIGLAEREGEHLYDSALLIDRDGRVLLRHRKVNILTELMTPPYTPGPGAGESVVDTRLGRIGMLICADTFLDDLVGEMAAAKPELLLIPYGWAAPVEAWPDHGQSLRDVVARTARQVRAPVVGVDGTGVIEHGPWTGFVFGGQSVVCDSEGEVLGVLEDREPQVRVFELKLKR